MNGKEKLVHLSGLYVRPVFCSSNADLGRHKGFDFVLLVPGPEAHDFNVFRGEFVQIQRRVGEQRCDNLAI